MFRVKHKESETKYRVAIAGLLVLSATALAITIWELYDFSREQVIVEELLQTLPDESTQAAEFLAGELQWQFRLTILVVLNVIVAGIAIALLWRAYLASQESLRDLKTMAGDILGSMEQAVITTDQHGVVTSINQQGIRLFGTDKDLVGCHLASLSNQIPLDEFRRTWARDRHSTKMSDYQYQVAERQLILRAFCQSLSDIDDNEIGFVLQLRDVTDRKFLEDRMRRMERYMSLGSVAVGLHHEIKNPLAALSLHMQLLEEELQESEKEESARPMLKVIKSETARMSTVLEGFRDFAAIESLDIQRVQVSELIAKQVRLLSPKAELQNVKFAVHISSDTPTEIEVDSTRLEQVLLNLFLNAIDAMSTGGEIRVDVTREGTFINITISDSGPGISSDIAKQIFEPYFTTKDHGTGLGLAVSDKIIRQHGGNLEYCDSKNGATFVIKLPMQIIFDDANANE